MRGRKETNNRTSCIRLDRESDSGINKILAYAHRIGLPDPPDRSAAIRLAVTQLAEKIDAEIIGGKA